MEELSVDTVVHDRDALRIGPELHNPRREVFADGDDAVRPGEGLDRLPPTGRVARERKHVATMHLNDGSDSSFPRQANSCPTVRISPGGQNQVGQEVLYHRMEAR